MVQKKNAKPVIIDGLDDAYIVEKSRSLMLMKEVPFTLGELKVLDTYLSRINARNPSAMTVRFSKEEYEDLMGIERMHPSRLEKYVRSLMGQTVLIRDSNARGGWRAYTLFDEAECGQDENGQWWIDLSCTPKAKKLFFNFEDIGYIRYQLKNVLPLTSKYSVLLYLYLLDNRFRRSWEISLDEFKRTVIRCTEPLYDEYKYLNQRILKKCVEEVNLKTDLTFSYEPVRRGRKTTSIKFNLVKDEVLLLEHHSADDDIDPDQLTIDDYEEIEDGQSSYLDLLIEQIPGYTPEDLDLLYSLAVESGAIPYEPHHPLPVEIRICEYIKCKIKLMNSYPNIKSKMAWLKKAVTENWE